MYSNVRPLDVLRGPMVKVLPVTGAMMIGWNLVAAAVLLSVGTALLGISRVLVARARRDDHPA